MALIGLIKRKTQIERECWASKLVIDKWNELHVRGSIWCVRGKDGWDSILFCTRILGLSKGRISSSFEEFALGLSTIQPNLIPLNGIGYLDQIPS